MRHNVLKTFDNKVAATTDQIGAAITRIGLARPVDAGNLHLQIQTATAPDFSDAVTAIDTYANEADRAKVLLFDGSGFAPIEEGGAGASFGGQSVLADVASIDPLQYVRLRWFEVLEPMRYLAWDGRYFPASGGGGGASSASASTTGTLMVNITGDATGGWNIDGSSTWLASGATISLAPGQYTVFFKRAANVPPNPKPATIYAGAVTEIAGAYSLDAPAGSWVDVDITGPAEARWSYNGGLTWIVSGFEVNLLGDYTLTFKPVTGYDTPSNQSITAGAFPGDETYTATYAAAGSGATGYSAYLMGTAGPELISAQADPTKCVGGDLTLNIINGMLFSLNQRIGTDSDWASCSGAIQGYTGGTLTTCGYAVKTDGTLHAISAEGNVSQIGVATNWAAVSGLSGTISNVIYTAYALNTSGELYALQGAVATKIGASTTWGAVSGYSSAAFAAIAIDAGKLYRIDGDTPTQIGVAANWAAVGPSFNGVCLAKNDAGELFVVQATSTTTATQVGVATDWDELGHVHATNDAGKLYRIDGDTPTQVGEATNWSALAGKFFFNTRPYALNTSGELYSIAGETATRVGAASDWIKLAGGDIPIAVRGTAL